MRSEEKVLEKKKPGFVCYRCNPKKPCLHLDADKPDIDDCGPHDFPPEWHEVEFVISWKLNDKGEK